MNLDSMTLPTEALAAAEADPRIVSIVVYPDGWVPGAYKWPAPGRRFTWLRDKDAPGTAFWLARMETIDRKRTRGQGPEWVGRSLDNGWLASG